MSLTTAQKAKLRTRKQYSRLYLAALDPIVVFACRINQTFTTLDGVVEFTYDGVTTGAYGDVVAGMTAYIGTSLGASDIGVVRVRKALTSNTFYIGEESGIEFDDDQYVTVVRFHGLHQRHLKVTADVTYMDTDIVYSDQHTNFDPVPIMGANSVLFVDSYPVAISFPDVANSWVFDDTIASYSFTASAGVVTNGTTTNPTLTLSSYPTNGYVEVALQVTSTTGAKSTIGYRYVLVFDADNKPISDFTLEECVSDREDGGGHVFVTLHKSSDIAKMTHRNLAILFSTDYFDGTQDSVGLHTDRENLWMPGWIYDHTNYDDPEHSPQKINFYTADFWMNKMPTFPLGVQIQTTGTWTRVPELTVDKGLFHLLHWRTTATQVMDVYLTGDTKYTKSVESAGNNIWQQIRDAASAQILAQPVCDALGRLFVRIPYNLLPVADRAAASTLVMALATTDYTKTTEVKYFPPTTSQVFLSGVVITQEGTGSSLYSLAPGHSPLGLGQPYVEDNLLLGTQALANELCGLVMAMRNNPYKEIPITLIANNRAFDIAPHLYATITLDEYSGVILPKTITRQFDAETGKPEITIMFEAATTPSIYVDGDIPIGDGEVIIPGPGAFPNLPKYDFDIPDIPPLDFPGLNDSIVTDDCASFISNMFPLSWSRSQIIGGTDTTFIASAYLPCVIRAAGSFAQTYIKLNGFWAGDAKTNWALYGVLGGVRVITATVTHNQNGNIATFSPVSNQQVDGFELELQSGYGSSVTYTPGATLATGSVDANNAGGVAIPVTPGDSYAIEGTGGPWDPGIGFPNNFFYWQLDMTGTIGLGDTVFYLTLPGIALFAEQVSAQHGRAYFVPSASSVNFRVSDSVYSDNTGTLGYILKSAVISGRAIYLGPSTLFNVCAV